MGLLFRSDGLISESPVLRVLDRSQFSEPRRGGRRVDYRGIRRKPGRCLQVCRVLLR